MSSIQNAEILCNSVVAITAPDMYDVGVSSIQEIRQDQNLYSFNQSDCRWPSIFNAAQVIVNRTTPPHRDNRGYNTAYDLLLSLGTHSDARLVIPELGSQISYKPGTMVELCGKILIHGVNQWIGGERICVAHFMRDNVQNRHGIPRPGWSHVNNYNF